MCEQAVTYTIPNGYSEIVHLGLVHNYVKLAIGRRNEREMKLVYDLSPKIFTDSIYGLPGPDA